MGKKIISPAAALKISKKNNINHEKKNKQQLNSLIKVLKPKVYITDSSSFKSLVQELTGNGSSSSTSTTRVSSPSPSPSSSSPPPPVETNSTEAFSDTYSLDSSFDQPCSNSIIYDEPMFIEDETAAASVEYLLMMNNDQQETELFAYQDLDLESWLLDMEPGAAPAHKSSCNVVACHDQFQQEVSIYDYELSGLLI